MNENSVLLVHLDGTAINPRSVDAVWKYTAGDVVVNVRAGGMTFKQSWVVDRDGTAPDCCAGHLRREGVGRDRELGSTRQTLDRGDQLCRFLSRRHRRAAAGRHRPHVEHLEAHLGESQPRPNARAAPPELCRRESLGSARRGERDELAVAREDLAEDAGASGGPASPIA